MNTSLNTKPTSMNTSLNTKPTSMNTYICDKRGNCSWVLYSQTRLELNTRQYCYVPTRPFMFCGIVLQHLIISMCHVARILIYLVSFYLCIWALTVLFLFKNVLKFSVVLWCLYLIEICVRNKTNWDNKPIQNKKEDHSYLLDWFIISYLRTLFKAKFSKKLKQKD